VNVFDLDRSLVSDYERFARSFTQIRAPDIRQQVEAPYSTDRFWPEPLVSINPRWMRPEVATNMGQHPGVLAAMTGGARVIGVSADWRCALSTRGRSASGRAQGKGRRRL